MPMNSEEGKKIVINNTNCYNPVQEGNARASIANITGSIGRMAS